MSNGRFLRSIVMPVILAVLTVLAIGNMSTAYARPADDIQRYNLFIGGVQVTSENCNDVLGNGTASFDPENVKITLNNAKLEISQREDHEDTFEYGIRSNLNMGAVTIELKGANTFTDDVTEEGTTNKYGIYVAQAENVTYTGGGTLDINIKDTEGERVYPGLEHHQSATLDGVKVNIDIDGSGKNINGIRLIYTNKVSLINGAALKIDVETGYAFDSDVQNNDDISVEDGCVFEAVTGGPFGALHGNKWVMFTDATKELGVLAGENAGKEGAKKWDGETDLATYKYIRIPYEHTWGDWKIDKKPTCTEKGTEKRVCESCGEEETREVAAAGHKWGSWEVTKEPTTKAEGEETRTCSVCGEKEKRSIKKLDPKPKKKFGKVLIAKAIAKGKTSLKIKWTKVKNASGYDIFFAKCNIQGEKHKCRRVKTVRGNKALNWTVKGLKKGTPYKLQVKAYTMKNGKKSYVRLSPMVHAFAGGHSGKYTNPKGVKVSKSAVSLKQGKSFKIKGKAVKILKNWELPSCHAHDLRYLTSNKKVAKVSKHGKVRAVGKGKCSIYCIASNGVYKKVKVTVK